MAWNDSIPQPSNKLRVSQGDLLANFQALTAYLTVNHTAIDGTGDQGKHKFIEMPAQAVTPTFGGTEIGLFSKVFTPSGVNELYIRQQDGTYIPFSSSYLLFSAVRDAWMFLPGNVLVKWNTVNVAVGTATYTFTTANSEPTFSGFVSVLAIPSTIGVTTNVINVDNVTATTFDYSSDQIGDMTFIAWGIPTPITP